MKFILAVLMIIAGLSSALAQASGPAAENVLIEKANAALAARNWQDAEKLLKQLIALAANRADYQKSLGDAQGNLGRYRDAVVSYDKAIALAEKNSTGAAAGAERKAALAAMFVAKGNTLLKLKDQLGAIAAYERAAPLSANPALAYFNLCAVMYNMGQASEKTVVACDKAITADPNKADAYFVKGSVLFGLGSIQNGKLIVSEAAVQALREYLTLAPKGPHVADVNAMLDAVK